MTLWQNLGGWIDTGANVGDKVAKFAGVGGKWAVVVIYRDDAAGPWNRDHFEDTLRPECNHHGVLLGGWCNGFGGDPAEDAAGISALVKQFGLKLVILDLESAYQWPGGDATLAPRLCEELRNRHSDLEIGLTTNGFNNSGIWNGRSLKSGRSMWDLRVRIIPQAYDAYYQVDGSTRPDTVMKWLKEQGPTDQNMARKGKPSRGVPLSTVHFVVEATGLDVGVVPGSTGSHLVVELADLAVAKKYGLTPGLSYYLIENAPDPDWSLLAAVRGKLYL